MKRYRIDIKTGHEYFRTFFVAEKLSQAMKMVDQHLGEKYKKAYKRLISVEPL